MGLGPRVLYDNPFSPFARKVRMALDYKAVDYETVDALMLSELPRLRALNPRAEVPVFVDGDLVICESAEIVAYIEDRWPRPALMPEEAKARVKARYWQRIADRVLDAVIHGISLWIWPTHQRNDDPPAGLIEAGREDLTKVMAEFEAALAPDRFLCGDLSIGDLAVFPHVTSLRFCGVTLTEEHHARTMAWMRRMRSLDVVARDLEAVRSAALDLFDGGPSPYEAEIVVWRGDRIEWLLARGFDAWWLAQRAMGKAVAPRSIR